MKKLKMSQNVKNGGITKIANVVTRTQINLFVPPFLFFSVSTSLSQILSVCFRYAQSD